MNCAQGLKIRDPINIKDIAFDPIKSQNISTFNNQSSSTTVTESNIN
jgi:hypothetical protein